MWFESELQQTLGFYLRSMVLTSGDFHSFCERGLVSGEVAGLRCHIILRLESCSRNCAAEFAADRYILNVEHSEHRSGCRTEILGRIVDRDAGRLPVIRVRRHSHSKIDIVGHSAYLKIRRHRRGYASAAGDDFVGVHESLAKIVTGILCRYVCHVRLNLLAESLAAVTAVAVTCQSQCRHSGNMRTSH